MPMALVLLGDGPQVEVPYAGEIGAAIAFVMTGLACT